MSSNIKTEILGKVYQKTNHFSNWLENTKDKKPQKYTDAHYSADLKKWFEDEKYSKGQMNSTEIYFLQKWIGKISEK